MAVVASEEDGFEQGSECEHDEADVSEPEQPFDSYIIVDQAENKQGDEINHKYPPVYHVAKRCSTPLQSQNNTLFVSQMLHFQWNIGVWV